MRGPPSSDKPKSLRMINHRRRGGLLAESGLCQALTRRPGLAHGTRPERAPRHLWHLPRDYELAIRWLRPSFLTRDHWTPGRKGRDIHGIATLRYLDQGKARLCAARSGECADVC